MSTRSLNKVQLIGNLTRDPELRYTASGTPVVTFGVATNRKYRDSSQNLVETAEFTNIVVWSKLAENCVKILKKGAKVYVEGRLSTSAWDDAKTGQKMRRTEVVCTDWFVLSSPRGLSGDAVEHSDSEHPLDASPSATDSGMDEIGDIDGVDFNAIATDDNNTKF